MGFEAKYFHVSHALPNYDYLTLANNNPNPGLGL